MSKAGPKESAGIELWLRCYHSPMAEIQPIPLVLFTDDKEVVRRGLKPSTNLSKPTTTTRKN